MRLRPMRFDLYLGRSVFTTVLLTWAVLVGLDVVMAFSGEFKDIGKNGYTLGHAAAWVLHGAAPRLHHVPTAAVIGALMGLGQLAATSELTALRALGLSRKRLSVSVAIALSLLTAVMVLSAETLGPWGQDRADALKSSASGAGYRDQPLLRPVGTRRRYLPQRAERRSSWSVTRAPA